VENKKILLVILTASLVGIIILESIYYSGRRGWEYPYHDAYINFVYAKNLLNGTGWKIYPDEPAFTAPSDYLLPLIHVPFYLFPIKNMQTMVFMDLILHLLLLIFSSLLIYKTFSELFGVDSILATILAIMHPVFSLSYFFGLNSSFFSFFFWGTLAFLKTRHKFLPFLFFLAISRPESSLAIMFIVCIYLFYIKKKEKFHIYIFGTAFFLSVGQFILNYALTGQLFTMGVRPQFLFRNFSLSDSITELFVNLSGQIKGLLIGMSSTTKLNFWLTGSITIPFLGILALIGFLRKKYHNFSIIFLIYFFIILIGDSSTVIAGMHFNRHIAYTYPFFMLMAFYGLKEISNKLTLGEKGFNLLITIFSIIVSITWFLNLTLFTKQVKRSKLLSDLTISASKFIPEGEKVITDSPYFLFNLIDKFKVKIISQFYSPVVSRYIPRIGAFTEKSELIQDMYSDVKYFYKGIFPRVPEGIKTLTEEVLWRSHDPEVNTTLYKINLEPVKKEHFLPQPYSLFWELDTGNPISEEKNKYRYFSSIEGEPSGFLQKGIIQDDTIWDGGRVIAGSEEFIIRTNPDYYNFLVIRAGGEFKGVLIKRDIFHPYNLKLDVSNINIFAEGILIARLNTERTRNFIEWVIPIPEHLAKKRNLKIRSEGNFISYHYFVYIVPRTNNE